ncbi:hypothetical protein [Nitrosomonas ureae]|nr:hypothetical protein [Nitrosomonas ureae]
MSKIFDKETIQARIQILAALKRATAEAKKLNSILDDMHNMLEANANKKAA